DLDLVRKMAMAGAEPEAPVAAASEGSLVSLVERRVRFLTEYQNERLARRYKDFVVKVQTSEAHRVQGAEALTSAVARYYFKLLAYKDEYEVARLHTETDFLSEIGEKFEAGYKLKYHLAPPLLARRDPDTGEARKIEFGEWILPALRTLAKLKFLRGTPLDVFGYTQERKRERGLITDFEAVIEGLLRDLTPENHGTAVEIAALPEQIRGYGHVKERSIAEAKSRESELLEEFRNPSVGTTAAAE
ncbi:MAG: indolepyruvate ferredoxin oxidoreductase family protein, partial [Alphaproteobacteria bacterium]|nr:indolepyruvate ferredoxin oxidoreductase family protein [Alphaproteobacteria bacterium]